MRVKNWGVLLLCIAGLLGTVACSGGKVAPNGMTGAEILEISQNASVSSLQFSATSVTNFMGSENGYEYDWSFR